MLDRCWHVTHITPTVIISHIIHICCMKKKKPKSEMSPITVGIGWWWEWVIQGRHRSNADKAGHDELLRAQRQGGPSPWLHCRSGWYRWAKDNKLTKQENWVIYKRLVSSLYTIFGNSTWRLWNRLNLAGCLCLKTFSRRMILLMWSTHTTTERASKASICLYQFDFAIFFSAISFFLLGCSRS